ncbi:MAG: hypothetical protein N3G80_03765 [Candidatus Micrarchaeota archaeon]|nr:hypothetical protein [Candidatus Micrarchaeota archaeon]
MANVCIICEKEKSGFPVQDDYVILAIRKVKNFLRIAKNNNLVVCQDCLEVYQKKRAKYERDLAIHAIIGGFILLTMIFLPIFTTGFSLTAVFFGLLLFGLVMLLSVFSHCPKIQQTAPKEEKEAEPSNRPEPKKPSRKKKK